MLWFLKLVGGIAAMVALVPLMVWAGSGSWRQAVTALRQYLLVLGVPALAIVALALVMALLERIG